MANVQLESLLATLQAAPTWTDVYNPYGPDAAGAVGRANLRAYLNWFLVQEQRWLLVGEALGYRGGARTGIPFTSEGVLLGDKLSQPRPAALPHSAVRVPTPRALWQEASATIVWRTLQQLCPTQLPWPVLWNAFPLHPHRSQNLFTNRLPIASELRWGGEVCYLLLELLQPSQVVAVGRQAARVLTRLEIDHVAVRHPARGGKAAFVAGLNQLQLTTKE